MLPVAVTVDVQLVLCLDGEVMSVELAKKHSNSGDPAPRRPDVDDMNCATRRSWLVVMRARISHHGCGEMDEGYGHNDGDTPPLITVRFQNCGRPYFPRLSKLGIPQ